MKQSRLMPPPTPMTKSPHRHHRRAARSGPGPPRRRHGAVRRARSGPRPKLAALGYDVADLGNIDVAQAESLPDHGPTEARYLPQIAESCEASANWSPNRWRRPSPARARRRPFHRRRNRSRRLAPFSPVEQKIGLLWIDAHADMNTPESSPSGNVHGMPLACCVGVGPGTRWPTCSASRPRSTRERRAGRHPRCG
jgi:hypothetical protein